MAPVVKVTFGALPPPGSRRRVENKFGPALALLMQTPQEWARIATYPSRAGAWHVPKALEKAGFTEFEFEVRSSGDESTVWARYTPKKARAAA